MPNIYDQFLQQTPEQNGTSPAAPANPYAQFLPDYKPPPEQGDFVRGAKVALGQTMPILKGVVGLVGATAENALGEGGVSTAIKNWGLNGYKDGMHALEPLQKDTDELTTAWDKAKDGNLGALVDWVQYSLGYAVGQGGEAMLTSLAGGIAGGVAGGGIGAVPGAAGGLVAKGAVKEFAASLIQKAVTKEAAKIAAESGGKIAADEAVTMAVKNVTKDIGSTSALLAYSSAQELGSIYPDAEDQAAKEGRKLDGMDLARVWGSGIVAGGIEGLTDKLGIEAAMGKVRVPGATSRVGSAALTGAAGVLTEGGTEAAQTVIEHYGAGQPIADEAGIKDIINSAGQGAVGGGFIGGGAGFIHGPSHHQQAAAAALQDIAAAPDADAAIAAFNTARQPLVVPPSFDAEGAMARMQRAKENDEAGLRDFTGRTPEVTKSLSGADAASAITSPQAINDMIQQVTGGAEPGGRVEPTGTPDASATPGNVHTPAAPTALDQMQAGVPQTFQDRLETVQAQLGDSRVRQMIRDTGGTNSLNDALYMAQEAGNDQHPGETSDDMLSHAERILDQAGVPPLKSEVLAQAKAQQAAQKRADAEAKAAESKGASGDSASSGPDVLKTDTKAAAKVALKVPHNATDADMVEAAREAGYSSITYTSSDGRESLVVPGAKNGSTQGSDGARAESTSAVSDVAERQGQVPESTQSVLPQLRGAGDQDAPGVGGKLSSIPGGSGREAGAVNDSGAGGEQRQLRAGESDLGDETRTGQQPAKKSNPDGLDGSIANGRDVGAGTGDSSVGAVLPAGNEDRGRSSGNAASEAPKALTLKDRADAMKARAAETPSQADTGGNVATPAPVDNSAAPVDLGATVKHTTGKGKDIFGHILRDATDAEARAIDPYTFKKDGGYFIRERHADALTEFERTRPPKEQTNGNEAPPVNEEGGQRLGSEDARGQGQQEEGGRSGADRNADANAAAPAADANGQRDVVDGSRADDAAQRGGAEVQGAAQEEVAPLAERAAAAKEAAPEAGTLTGHLESQIRTGAMPKDNPALRKLVETYDGKPATQARMKEAQEALESAIVRVARGIARFPGVRPADTFQKLLALYQSQPNLNVRTSTSIENQAYSTPAPLAFLAGKLARVTNDTTLYEPTAGTGMLTMLAKPANVTVNELNPDRIELLNGLGLGKVMRGDALHAQVDWKSQDRVIANPPFGPLEHKVKYDKYTIGQIDHLIALKALETMKDDGAATLILGASKVAGGVSAQDRTFLNYLYGNYNVTSHFEVDGALYTRQGASWPVRVITIEGREKSDRIGPLEGVIGRANTWDEVYERYEQGLATGRAGRGLTTGVVSSTAAGPDEQGPVRGPAVEQTPTAGRQQPAAGESGAADVGGVGTGPVVGAGAVPTERVGQRDRADGPGAQPDRADSVGRRDIGADRAGQPAGNSRVPRVAPALEAPENQFQAPYTPRSARKDTGVLIPVNMREPTQHALSRLEDAVGDIDAYAAKKLGYASVDELHNAFMGLQVDSVASAIHQIESGKGVIIADQTGIGKGRQAAAIIRYAVQQGRIPIFASVKPSLFTDMFGDLHDIGSDNVAPYILNSTEWIKGAGDEKLFANKPAQHKRNLSQIAETGMLPEGSNALFMTYSQINVPNVQRQAVTALAPRAIFILDESHNAGGDSQTGDFIKQSLDLSKGVVYLSATYAKRPDNMPLYFKTDMGEAAADDNTLMSAMEMGGLPLQTVVSNNLVAAGQMFRRERSYDGVEIRTETDTANRELHEKQSDAATQALRAIVAADRMFHEVYFKARQKEAKEAGGMAMDNAGNQAGRGVDRTQFTSVVHNFVRQMLLGLEADKSADLAIAALQNGQKPLIALEGTMGSFLDAYVEANNLKEGASLGSFDYRTVLSRALERTRYYSEQQPNGDKKRINVKLSELDPLTTQAYAQAQDVIDSLKLDIPVSPIDWMRNRLQKAGFSVAEITGRDLAVDYSSGKPVLGRISQQEQKDKVATTRAFNSGQLDAIILNVAGSTGISLHASEKFTDQRQRKMIVAQAAQDINIFMQMLGRIHRTGQVALPSYTLLNADLPAVKRPTAILSGKMKSLNANTSSNTESATSVRALDMLNKYGDQVVAEYLRDNPKLAQLLDIKVGEASLDNEEASSLDDVARKATGRLALLPVEQQRTVYADLEQQYGDLIDYLNKTGTNDLEPRTADFDAREMRSAVLFEGQNPESPFGQDAIYNEYSIKAQGVPPTPTEVRQAMLDSMKEQGVRSGQEHASALIDKLNTQLKAYFLSLGADVNTDFSNDANVSDYFAAGANVEQAKNVARNAAIFIREHSIGSAFRISVNDEAYTAVVTNIRSTHKENGNPFSMSKIQVTLAVNGALRNVTVPASRFAGIETSAMQQPNIDTMFKVGRTDERQTAKIITGNLLAAYGELKGVRGTIVSFTKEDGTVAQGILLPKAFEMAKNTQGDFRLPSGEAALQFLRLSIHKDIGRFGIQSRDGLVRVLPDGNGIKIQVPKSKAKGGKYFLDDQIRAVTGDFVTSGQMMVAEVPSREDAVAALDVLMKKSALYTLPSMAHEARDIVSSPNVQPGTGSVATLTNPDRTGAPQQTVAPRVDSNSTAAGAAANMAADPKAQPWVRELAGRLQPFLDHDTPVRYLRAGDKVMLPSSVAELFRKGGIFGVSEVDPISGRGAVYMRYDADHPVGQEDLLHELTHAATQRALSITKSAPIRAELQSILGVLNKTFDQVMTSPRANEQARNDAAFFQRVMTDEHELLAYGMTSRTFRQWSQSLDANGRLLPKAAELDQGAAPKMTLWQRLVDAVRQLIGMSKLYQPRLEALLSRREADALAFRTANTPETLARRLDTLLRQTMELRTSPEEYAAEWSPRKMQAGNVQAGASEVMGTLREMKQDDYRNLAADILTSHASTNIWQRTVGTQYAKAEANPTTFKPVFDATQDYIKDNSIFANAAADRAPDLLPKLDRMSDLWKDGVMGHGAKPEDVKPAGRAVFEGTLKWARDENGALVDIDAATDKARALTTDQKARVLFKAGLVTEAELKRWQATPLDIYDGAVNNRYEQKLLRPGVVFSDAELKSMFSLSDKQIDLYRQFRASTDQSLDDLGRSEVIRLAGKTVGDETRRAAIGADTLEQAAQIISARIDQMTTAENSADRRDELTALRNDVNDKANRIDQLKGEGYAPLMRFGENTVDVVDAAGERLFFGTFETQTQANMAARGLREQYPGATVTQGKMSKEGSQLYQGLNLHALELFAENTGKEDNAVYQDFLRLTKNNRSALKRLIERKGIAGFNEDAQRVLASFVTSNSRMAAGNMNFQRMTDAAEAIPKEMGDLKDEAIKLVKYVQSPGNEAPAIRGLLFTNFIGGSVASAMVNLTQPFTMSMPYLSQYGGAVRAGKALLAATKAAATGKVDSAEITKALHDNVDIVSPQEIHHLQSAAMSRLGDHPLFKKAAFLWGSMFSLSEQFNRRVTFIAAYQTALDQQMANPTAFARKAVIETQGLYNKGNKPNAARGAFGATVMTFKQFSIHYLEFLQRMWKSGPEGKKAVGVALATLVLASGVGGLPFADDLDDLIDTLAQAMGYDFSSKKAKRQFAASVFGDMGADFLTRGLSGISGMPIDVSLRMGMGNLIPATGILLRSNTDRMKDALEVFGAAGGLGKNAIDSAAALLQGDPGKAALGMAPLAIQNMVKAADMFNTGTYKDTRGRKVMATDTGDAVAKFLGFQPGAVARESMLVGEAMRSIQLSKNVEAEIVSKWAQGLDENNPEMVTQARQQLATWNADNDANMRVTMQQIIHKVRELRSTRQDRVSKTAPKEMRNDVRAGLQR